MSTRAAVSPPDVAHGDLAVDAAAIGVVSLGIVTMPDQTAAMTALVATAILARFVFWRGARLPEVLFFGLCTVLGAFNDWSSVVRHRIYDYDVAVWWPQLTTVPVWMLLYWGLILRFLAQLAWWRGLSPPRAVSTGRSAAFRIAVMLALIVVTRQAIYRLYDHPMLSWLPFAAALLVYAVVLRPTRHDLRLGLVFLIGGPAIEILYIQLGGLHRYHHGIVAGVPIWIVLWWVLAVLIWKDLSARLLWRCARLTAG